MNKSLRSLFQVSGLVTFWGVFGPVFAQADTLGIKLTGNTPVSNVSVVGSQKNGGFGLSGGFEYLHSLGSLEVGAELDILSRSENTGSILPNVTTKASGMTTQVLAVSRVVFLKESRIQPYAGAGLGVARVSLKGKGRPKANYSWNDTHTAEERVLVDESATGFAFALRGGLDVLVSGPVSVGYELGYNGTSSMTFGSLKGSTNSITNSVVVRVRL